MALIGNQREWILNGRLLVYTCSHEHEKAFVVSGAHISEGQWQTSTAGAGFMDPALQTLKAMLEAIGDARGECVRPNRAIARATFDAMDMQSVPVNQAFHESCSLGSRRQMSSMQKHRVQTYSVRKLSEKSFDALFCR